VTSETRRMIRTLLQGIVTITLLVFIWLWTPVLNQEGLLKVILSLIAIIGIQTLGNQMENGLRAFKGKLGKDGAEFDLQGEGE
jgi:hypothetical protein